MEKEVYLKKREELDQQYIAESGIIGKMFLSFIKEISQEGNLDEWVEVFKVRSADIEKGEIFVDKIEHCSISKYTNEDGVEYNISEFREPNEKSMSLGIQPSRDCGEIEIDEGDYKNIIDIICGGDSDRSVEQRFDEVCDYLLRSGFRRFIQGCNEVGQCSSGFEGD